MTHPLDSVEVEYVRGIAGAAGRGENDVAQYLQIGLDQYHELYKTDHEVAHD